MKLKITNRSDWPDWFVRPVCRWIVSRAKITRDYEIELPKVTDPRMWAGRAGSRHQRSRIHRRLTPSSGWPWQVRYWRYQWSRPYLLANRIEAFVYLVSHEAAHATIGNPGRFRKPNGRCDDALMESACETFAQGTVDAFRLSWPAVLRHRVIAAARKHRASKRVKKSRRADPSPKLAHAQGLLDKWQSKLKRAQTAIKKYRRQVKYYEGRVAARGQGRKR